MKWRIVVILVIVLFLVAIFFIFSSSKKDKPINIINSKLNITLPTSSVVKNFDYHKKNGYFYAKILIDKQDIESINNSLINFFKKEYTIKNKDEIPHFENTATWWDMDKDRIEVCYFTVVSGKKHLFVSSPKSIEIWVFIVKNNSEEYYLYIYY